MSQSTTPFNTCQVSIITSEKSEPINIDAAPSSVAGRRHQFVLQTWTFFACQVKIFCVQRKSWQIDDWLRGQRSEPLRSASLGFRLATEVLNDTYLHCTFLQICVWDSARGIGSKRSAPWVLTGYTVEFDRADHNSFRKSVAWYFPQPDSCQRGFYKWLSFKNRNTPPQFPCHIWENAK